MTRSPPSMPRALTLTLLASLALVGCDRGGDAASPPKADAPKADAPKADAPKADAPEVAAEPVEPPPPPEAPLAAGWTRLDLSTLDGNLTGTVDLPPGITASARIEQEQRADGLTVNRPSVQIGPRGCGVNLAPLAEKPTRFASAEAMARFHGGFEHVETREVGADHWAVVHRWRPGECMSHGWSGAAGLKCDVFKCPCDDMKQWVDVCASLQAGSAPNTVQATAAAAFPKLDPAAAEVAVKVARAIAGDDKAALAATVGPEGVKIGGAAVKGPALDARLARTTVLEAVSPEWVKTVGDSIQYGWTAEGLDAMPGRVFFSSGYGEVPYFDVAKIGADWRLVEFGVFDMGEP